MALFESFIEKGTTFLSAKYGAEIFWSKKYLMFLCNLINRNTMKKHKINFLALSAYTILCLITLSTELLAQSEKKNRLIISDEIGGFVTKIDTLLPAGSDPEKVLLQLGYDSESIAKSYSGNKARKITVQTEEIITSAPVRTTTQLPPQIRDLGTTSKSTLIQKPTTDHFDLDKMLNLPPGALVEETPEGKKITYTTTDDRGNISTEEILINTFKHSSNAPKQWQTPEETNTTKPKKQPIRIENGIATPIVPPQEQTNLVRTETFTHSNNSGSQPDVKVTLSPLDMFDHSTLNNKNPNLLNAQTLHITNFSVKPDFEQGYLRFSFKNADAAANAISQTQIAIYDVLGYPIFSEMTGDIEYNKLITDFHLYKRGSFLILITLDNKKFTQRLTLQ